MEPNPFDAFRARLKRRLAELASASDHEFRNLELSHARTFASGATIRAIVQAIAHQMIIATDWALSETQHLPGQSRMARKVMMPDLENALRSHLADLTERARWRKILLVAGRASDASHAAAEKLYDEISAALEGELSDFAGGVWSPRNSKPNIEITHNASYNQNFNAEMSGVAQQAGPGSSQSASVNVSGDDIAKAVDSLVAALKDVTLSSRTREDLEIDIATIRAQLRKTQPDLGIMKGAGKAIAALALSVAEGIATPEVRAMLAALGVH